MDGEGLTPIGWSTPRGGRATLPILIAPGATPTTIDVSGITLAIADAPQPVARARIDAARYVTAPADIRRDRARPLWLVATATLTLALAALLPRRATAATVSVALAWSIGLAVALAARPAIDRVDAADGTRWLIARRVGTASVPIEDGAAWVPIVESQRHWRALAPRIVVDADGHATLEFTLPTAGARVALTLASPP